MDQPLLPLFSPYEDFYCALSEIVLYSPHPVPQRGRFAIVTDVGCGTRWAHWIAARACSLRTNDPVRRWSRVVLASRCWCQVGEDEFVDDGGKKPVPGEIAYKP